VTVTLSGETRATGSGGCAFRTVVGLTKFLRTAAAEAILAANLQPARQQEVVAFRYVMVCATPNTKQQLRESLPKLLTVGIIGISAALFVSRLRQRTEMRAMEFAQQIATNHEDSLMAKKMLFLAIVLLLRTQVLLANEARQHYLVAQRNGKPAFQVTRIHDGNASLVKRTYLIADNDGPLLRIDLVSDYANRQTISTYALLRGTRPTATIVLELPFASTTITARRDELRKHPELANAPVPVTIRSSGRTLHGLDEDWRRSPTAETHRTRAKEVLGKELTKAIADIREIAGLPMFADINASLGYVLDVPTLVGKSVKLMVAPVSADCEFDAKFAVPCGR